MDLTGALPALLVRSAVHHALAAPAAMTGLDGGGRQVLHTRVYLICCSGVAFGILAGLCRWAPRAWQLVTTARGRRVLAFVCVSLTAAAIGLPFPGAVTHAPGTLISLAAAVGGFRCWNLWRQRWCGAGENPNLLTGLVRPPVRPGQLWWSTAPNQDAYQSGQRAVLVIGRHPGGSWDVAPVTFQDQGGRLAGQLEVSPQRIRQFTSAGWLNLTDRIVMSRDQLRGYIGRTPHTFYREVCAHAGLLPDPFPGTRDRVADRAQLDVRHDGEAWTDRDRAVAGPMPWWTQPRPESPDGPPVAQAPVVDTGTAMAGRVSQTCPATRETVVLPWSLPGGGVVDTVPPVPR